MKAIQLYDKFSEEIVGTILTQEHNYNLVCEKWDIYQQENNSESENDAKMIVLNRYSNSFTCEDKDLLVEVIEEPILGVSYNNPF